MLQGGKCAITGIPMKFYEKNRNHRDAASVDRIDSSKGYSKDNIHLVISSINIMKMDLPLDVFIELCTLVVNGNKNCSAQTLASNEEASSKVRIACTAMSQ